MAHTRWIAAAAVAALALVAGAACGGGGGNAGANTPAASAAAGSATITTPEMDQDNLSFKPEKLTVKAGEKVIFKNSESAVHTVTINGKNESGTMKKGDVFAWTPTASGTYKITCDFHPQMKATITVE